MKKIGVLVLIFLLLASISFAAAAKAPVAKSITSPSSGIKMGLGSYVLGGYNSPVAPGYAAAARGAVLLDFIGETFTGGVGLSYSSVNANNASNTAFGLVSILGFNISGGAVPTHIGGIISYDSIPNGSTFAISLAYGVSTVIANSIIIGFDVIPLTFGSTNQNNATTTFMGVGTAALHAAYLL